MAIATTTIRRLATTATTTGSRAVHIKLEPKTRSIHESREILRVLKTFGTVIWYQNLSYDRANPAPHTLICIYEQAAAASEVIRQSPMRFRVAPPPRITEPVTSPASMDLWRAFPEMRGEGARQRASGGEKGGSGASGGGGGADEASSEANEEGREFVLTADVSLQDHEAALQQKEYSWGFRNHRRTFAQAALAREVPEKGMAHLPTEAKTVPARIVNKKKGEVDRFIEDVRRRLDTER